MKKALFLLTVFNFFPSLSQAIYVDGFKGLNIKTIDQYPNLRSSVAISGKKTAYEFPSTVPLSNRSIYSFLKSAVNKGNIESDYLSSEFDWELFPIKDMQPGWEYAYNPMYFPKYYSFSPYKWDKDAMYEKLSNELGQSPWPKDALLKNFDLIFDKNTPVYMNDLMFSVDKDDAGFYGSNILGLTRFGLPESTSETYSAIHLSMSKISVKTLIHEYLHDKIRFDSKLIDPDHVIYNNMPLLGLGDVWNDKVVMAYKIRDVIDNAYIKRDEKSIFVWWKPLANTDKFTSSYSFSNNLNETENSISEREMWNVMQFLEELVVRIVVEALYKSPGEAIVETVEEIDGLTDLLGDQGISVLNDFVHNFYGNNSHQPTNRVIHANTGIEASPEITFTEEEQEMINKAVEEAIARIRLLYKKL